MVYVNINTIRKIALFSSTLSYFINIYLLQLYFYRDEISYHKGSGFKRYVYIKRYFDEQLSIFFAFFNYNFG